MLEHPKKKKFENRWYLLALAAVLVMSVALVSAKYVHKTQSKEAALAKSFYFTSDLLDGQTHNVTALNEDGTATVTVTLQNHADDLRYSETDIKYNVTVTGDGSSSPTITNPSGTIKAGEGHDAQVTISGLQPGKTYTVTAKTENAYSQEISGQIWVNPLDTGVYSSVKDTTSTKEVTVWTTDYSGNVKMTYPDGWIPDNTDPMMETWTTGKQAVTFSMKTNESHLFRFFKGKENVGSEVTVNAAQ